MSTEGDLLGGRTVRKCFLVPGTKGKRKLYNGQVVSYRYNQERVGDVRHVSEHSRFVEALHRAHKKRGDIRNEDSIAFGRAFKRALDIGKHGGRVPLPSALRNEVAPKKYLRSKGPCIQQAGQC